MSQESERVSSPGNTVSQADPGAASLTVYLGAMGWAASVEAVATWLNVVPVLAMEIGSASAGVLISSFKPAVTIRPLRDPLAETRVSERDIAASRLLTYLKDNGGETKG